jgi:hypothetical protein
VNSPENKEWQWPSVVGLGLLAMFLGMLIGFIPQVIWEKFVSPPFSNTGFVVALPVGFLLASFGIGYVSVAKFDASRAACYAWIVGICWLCFGLVGNDGAWNWSPEWTRLSRWDYAFSQMFAFPTAVAKRSAWAPSSIPPLPIAQSDSALVHASPPDAIV